MYKENIETLKNDNLTLKEIINRNQPENNKLNDMLSTQSVLANTISSMENRCQSYENKLKESQV